MCSLYTDIEKNCGALAPAEAKRKRKFQFLDFVFCFGVLSVSRFRLCFRFRLSVGSRYGIDRVWSYRPPSAGHEVCREQARSVVKRRIEWALTPPPFFLGRQEIRLYLLADDIAFDSGNNFANAGGVLVRHRSAVMKPALHINGAGSRVEGDQVRRYELAADGRILFKRPP